MQVKLSYLTAAVLAASLIGTLLVAPAVFAPTLAASEDKMIAPGRLRLSGRTMTCGRIPTLLSHTFWDFGGADKEKRRIILNPSKMEGLPKTVRWWIYAHECGHQIYGPGETRADCYAVERGKREGWLDQTGMDEICTFIRPFPADWVHPPGPKRCEVMQACFKKAKPRRARR